MNRNHQRATQGFGRHPARDNSLEGEVSEHDIDVVSLTERSRPPPCEPGPRKQPEELLQNWEARGTSGCFLEGVRDVKRLWRAFDAGTVQRVPRERAGVPSSRTLMKYIDAVRGASRGMHVMNRTRGIIPTGLQSMSPRSVSPFVDAEFLGQENPTVAPRVVEDEAGRRRRTIR